MKARIVLRMKTKTFLLLALASLLLQLPTAFAGQGGSKESPAQAQQTATPSAKWERYTYPGEEFSVELPEMPAVFHTVRNVANSIYDTEKMRVFGVYSGGVVFNITSYDKPRSQESLDYFATYHWGGRGLTPKGDVALGGFAGREYAPSNGLGGLARVFRTKRHAYLVWAIAIEASHPYVSRFMDSFALSAKPSGKPVAEDEPVPTYVPPQPPPDGTAGAGSAAPRTQPGAQPTPDTRPADGPFTQKEVTRQGVIVFKPEPGFTEEARRDNI